MRGLFRVEVAGLSRKASWRRQPSLSVEGVRESIRRDLGGGGQGVGSQVRGSLLYSLHTHTHTPPYLNLSGVLLIDYKLHERQTLLPKALMVHLVAPLRIQQIKKFPI